MPKALLIDLDDTLLDDRGSMASAVLRFRDQHDLARDVDDGLLITSWDNAGRQMWKRLALGEVTFQEQRRIRLRQVFHLDVDDHRADVLFTDYLAFYEQSWSLLPGAEEFLDATAHLPRAIVTNGHRPQAQRKLEKLGLTKRFNAVVTPEDCGARKPDPKIFTHTLAMLGTHASDALMIGDNPDADIAPALALGMQVFHVDPALIDRSLRHAAIMAVGR